MYFFYSLNEFLNCLKRLLIVLIGENISIWMTPFRFESLCARDDGMWWIIFQRWGDHIWSSWCGEFFYHESYCDERVVMTIYGFQIFCDVSSGGLGLCPYMTYGRDIPIYGDAATPRVFLGCLKCPLPYYLPDDGYSSRSASCALSLISTILTWIHIIEMQ